MSQNCNDDAASIAPSQREAPGVLLEEAKQREIKSASQALYVLAVYAQRSVEGVLD